MTDTQQPERTIRQPRTRVPTPPGLWARCAEWSAVAVAVTYLAGIVHARWFVLAAACAAVSAAAYTITAKRVRALVVWTLSWCALGAGWVLLAHLASPWQPGLAVALPAMALVMLPLGVRVIAHDTEEQRRLAERDAERDAAKYLGRWAAAFTRIGITGITALEETQRGSSRVVVLRLPQDGRVTDVTLRHARADLERTARLPRDSVRFETVERDSSLVRMHVVEKTFLGTAIPLPELPATMSVNDPLPLGIREDGTRHDELFRELATMILGVRGAGKTTLIHVLIALFGRCVDTIVCVIDIDKGDRLGAPWVRPWAQMKAIRPGIDWLATTREEAEIMLKALHRVGKARQASLAGGSKITPSAKLPQFVLIVDEMAGLLGMDYAKTDGLSNQQFFKLAMDLTRLWRSEAIEPVFATQRATGSFTGGNDLKSQCLLRIGMGTATQQEALSLYPDEGMAARLMSSLNRPGSALYSKREGGVPLPVMNYRLDPSQRADEQRLEQIAVENAGIRPSPDQVSLDAMGKDWDERWKRCPLYDRLMEAEHPPEEVPLPAERRRATVPDDIHTAFTEITGHLEDLRPPRPGGRAPDPARERIYSILAERDHLGFSVAELRYRLKQEGMDKPRETISRWLNNEMIPAGTVEKHNGQYRLRRDGPPA